MLHIHTSNRLEYLIQALAKLIKSSPLPSLIPENIVVQDQGMEKWLSMLLADNLGVWANSRFMRPDAMLWYVFREFLRTNTDISDFKHEIMVWKLMDILPKFINDPEFHELKDYLQADESAIKNFQLAWRIADVFDQYTVYRPNWLFDWEIGKQPLNSDTQANWQAILWRELTIQYGNHHRAKLRNDFFAKLSSSKPRFQRMIVFGISVLPEFHLEVLARLGQVIDVHVFVMNPCREYWGDIVTDNEMAHTKADYFIKGNTLLASMGKIGRNFIDMFNEYQHVEHKYFILPDKNTLLHHIQTDILNLTETGYSVNDQSIQIHNCHSPLREIEVLHDQLLALFVDQPQLLPKDILVMVSDIETYAPFIEAVFDTIPDNLKQIPFTIADRNLPAKNIVVNTFLAILELTKGRFTVNEVLNILESEIIQQHFSFTERDLELIRYWIDKTAIRWGMDKNDKARMNLPEFEENTWLLGLKRLLLGYALPTEMFQGILPYDAIEGSDSLILGKLISFIEQLFTYVQKMRQPHTIPEWSQLFSNLLEDFLAIEDADTQVIRKALNDLITNSQDFTNPVSYAVIFECLQHTLTKEEQSSSFMTGCVSFSAVHHSRSIPFKVICLLGMNDQSFPRPNKLLNFDLIIRHPKKGDRSQRHNDRYLFLEALLAAREYFYISYVGQSIHDNTIIPPSILVSELLDYINSEAEVFQVTKHPLQAFSPKYFNQTTALFSFSDEYCIASNALRQERQANSFFTAPLSTPEPEYKTIELNNLIKFFNHPTAFLLRQRLGIELQRSTEAFNSNEPFEVSGLERYSLNQTLIEKGLQGINLQEYKTIVKASGQLPHGQVGDYVYNKIIDEVKPFIQRVNQELQQGKREPVNIKKIVVGNITITGNLGKLWKDKLINYRYAKLKAKDFIQVWIQHLILNSLPDLPSHSIVIGANEAWEFLPVADSKYILQNLVQEYYWQGLIQPLLFFPQTSFCFVENFQKDKDSALYKATETWQGSDFNIGEIQDNYYKLCFGTENNPLLNKEFTRLAQQFFEPLLEHRKML